MYRNRAPDPIYDDFSSQLQYNTIENQKLIDVKTEIPSSNAKNNNVQEFKFTSLSLETLSASENTDGAGLENNEGNEFISKSICEDESSSEGLQISPKNICASETTDGVGLENNEDNEFISKLIYEDESSSEGLQISVIESESSVDFKTCSIENSTYQYSQGTGHSTKNLTVVETTHDICRKEEIIQEDDLSTDNLLTKIEITEHGVSLENIEALENIYRDYSENVTDKVRKVNQKSVELPEHSVEKEKEPVKKTRGQKKTVQVNTADIYKNYSENVIDKSSKGNQKSIGTPEHNVDKEQGPVKKTRGRKKTVHINTLDVYRDYSDNVTDKGSKVSQISIETSEHNVEKEQGPLKKTRGWKKKILTNALDKFVCRTKNKIKTGPKKNISIEKFEKLFIRLDRIDISNKLHSISDNSKNLDIFTKSYAVDNLEESSEPGAGKEKILGINLPEVDETIVCLKRKETKEGISKTETNLKAVAFRCSNFNKVMENDKRYRKHMGHCNNTVKLLKTCQEEFQCYHCNKVVKHRISLLNHITQCHTEGERRYHCDHCIYETNLKRHLKAHVYRIHVSNDIKPTFKCKLCPHQTTDKASLNHHVMRVHLKIIKKKKCDQCDWEGDAALFGLHVRKVHLGEEYFCAKCSYKTNSKGNLGIHQLSHNKIKEFTCPQCPYQTHYRKCLDDHIKTHKYSFTKCPECFKILKESALKGHIQRGHKEKVKKKCPECGKEVQLLRKHMLTHSGADRKQKCSECSFACIESYYLRKHIRDYHEGKRIETFTCYHCNKELAVKTSLIAHLQAVHTVQKPCKCHICGSMLKSKMYLNAHLRRVHVQNDMWFECDLCPEDKRFKTKTQTSLKWHRVRHLKKNEVTIFKCEYCSYETRVPRNLNKHVAKRHPKKAKKFKR